jgi:hypothetical protein
MFARCQQTFPNDAQVQKGVVPSSAHYGAATSPADVFHLDEVESVTRS